MCNKSKTELWPWRPAESLQLNSECVENRTMSLNDFFFFFFTAGRTCGVRGFDPVHTDSKLGPVWPASPLTQNERPSYKNKTKHRAHYWPLVCWREAAVTHTHTRTHTHTHTRTHTHTHTHTHQITLEHTRRWARLCWGCRKHSVSLLQHESCWGQRSNTLQIHSDRPETHEVKSQCVFCRAQTADVRLIEPQQMKDVGNRKTNMWEMFLISYSVPSTNRSRAWCQLTPV